MFELLGISSQALFGQLLIGLINGSFYALLSLGLAVIFGMLNIINFTHGAQYMLGAFAAYFLLLYAGLGYWWAIIVAPIIVGITGIIIERLFLQWLYKLDHLYGLLLTFGLALIFEGTFRNFFGSSGLPYSVPPTLQGGQNLGFMFLPNYRAWVVVFSLAVCLTTWFVIERTKLGSYLRAATENPTLVRAFGINVPRMITLTYGFGVALAALAGVMAAPIYNVSPQMGANLIIVVFAVVVIGGMGSIMGAIVTGFGLGIIEGLTKVFFPEASNTVIFIAEVSKDQALRAHSEAIAFVVMACALVIAPMFAYPVFLMKALCFALFACAFNLLIGYVGLLSFGHALFFGWASYVGAHAAKVWGFPPELAILSGTATGAGLGAIVGALAIRRQGIYFAMITLALAQMMYFFAIQAPFTHGEDGIQAVPRGKLFGLIDLANQTNMYVTVLVIFLGCFLLIYRIINSPFGEVLKAIRENEARAVSLGYRTERYKLVAFVLSATFAGVAGATKALVFQLASLTDVDWPMSGEVILMTLVGGLGTLFGPVVGAFFMVTLENYLTTIGQWVFVVQGVIFVVCVLLFRRGIVGELAQILRVKL
jgi:branched-chain amino acid transport system permease protein